MHARAEYPCARRQFANAEHLLSTQSAEHFTGKHVSSDHLVASSEFSRTKLSSCNNLEHLLQAHDVTSANTFLFSAIFLLFADSWESRCYARPDIGTYVFKNMYLL